MIVASTTPPPTETTRYFVTPELKQSLETLAAAAGVSIRLDLYPFKNSECYTLNIYDVRPKQAKAFARLVKTTWPELHIKIPRDPYLCTYSEFSNIPTGTVYKFNVMFGPVPC